MAPIIEISNETLEAFKILKIPYRLRKEKTEIPKKDSGFIYVPSLKLSFTRDKLHLGENWFDSHRKLQEQEFRMPTIPEHLELLKYAKENDLELYKEITEVRNPWRTEWLDADFKVQNGKLYVNSNHVLDSKGNLVPEYSKPLSRTTLMEDSKISLEYWINNHTKQGFPTKKTKKGNLSYLSPRDDDNSVALFLANSDRALFDYNWFPSDWSSDLGVRAVKRDE